MKELLIWINKSFIVLLMFFILLSPVKLLSWYALGRNIIEIEDAGEYLVATADNYNSGAGENNKILFKIDIKNNTSYPLTFCIKDYLVYGDRKIIIITFNGELLLYDYLKKKIENIYIKSSISDFRLDYLHWFQKNKKFIVDYMDFETGNTRAYLIDIENNKIIEHTYHTNLDVKEKIRQDPLSSLESMEYYFIQDNSYKISENAIKRAGYLKKECSMTVFIKLTGSEYYQVFVGPFNNKEKIDDMISLLKDTSFGEKVIIKEKLWRINNKLYISRCNFWKMENSLKSIFDISGNLKIINLSDDKLYYLKTEKTEMDYTFGSIFCMNLNNYNSERITIEEGQNPYWDEETDELFFYSKIIGVETDVFLFDKSGNLRTVEKNSPDYNRYKEYNNETYTFKEDEQNNKIRSIKIWNDIYLESYSEYGLNSSAVYTIDNNKRVYLFHHWNNFYNPKE